MNTLLVMTTLKLCGSYMDDLQTTGFDTEIDLDRDIPSLDEVINTSPTLAKGL